MAWESNTKISLIDINADPFIHEIIEIPEEIDDTEEVKSKLSHEVASSAVPFFDKSPYLVMCSDKPA